MAVDEAANATDAQGATPKHRFWCYETVPDRDSREFRRVMLRNPDHETEKEGRISQTFIPKDEHCGTWHSSPNSKSHASFGDGGTTASVSCYGDLVQMSQYLGAGHSGMFSMDQRSTEEPYLVRARAEDLDGLSASVGTEFSIGLQMPWDFCPPEPPQVKWVNWRWPRYEYDTKIPNVKASFQYVVHKGAVLQQFVLTNSGEGPVDFECHPSKDMLVRDLDYLDSAYPFNEADDNIYTRISGPNGYGHVCVAALSRNDDSQPVGGSSNNHGKTTGIGASQLSAQAHSSDSAAAINVGMNPRTTNLPPIDESKTQAASGTAREDSKRVQESDKINRGPVSVAAIINMFVNGQAIQIKNEDDEWEKMILKGNQAGPNGHVPGTMEIVISYKLMLLTHSEIDWRRFLVSAQDADVSNILQEETERLWENAELPSICSLGLSLAEPVPSTSPVSTPTNPKSEVVGGEPKEEARRESNDDKKLDDDLSTARILVTSEANRDSIPMVSESQNLNLENLTLPSGTPIPGSPRSHIEYLAWRHLEHILSTCAIPCLAQESNHSISPTNAASEQDQRKDDVIIALTCGDMSGHRICTSASFFAFLFLIEVARRLVRHPVQIPYTKTLLKRIRHVLRGHIQWLGWLRKEEAGKNGRLLESGCFAANYWVTGEIERSANAGSWQPNDSVTDTPFQVLKMVEYIKFCKDCGDEALDDSELAKSILKDVWVPWFHALDQTDKRASFAWPHAKKEGVDTFRLVDHFWVWKALKELEDSEVSYYQPLKKHNLKDQNGPPPKPVWDAEQHKWTFRRYASLRLTSEGAYEKFGKVARRLHASDTQRGMLQRFTTTENDISGKRMLAVTRSPRETRFLLHARDAALFYAADCGFFLPRSSFEELWANTLEIQIRHNDNQETGWDNTIRYALGVVAGIRGWTLNHRSADELVRNCIKVLMSSCSHNGFFPAQLDEATKEPNLFYAEEDRDYYYHAGFEINYILLTHANRINQLFDQARKIPKLRVTSASTLSSRYERTEPQSHLRPEKVGDTPGTTVQGRGWRTFDEPSPYHKRSRRAKEYEPELPVDGPRSMMKKFIPFNSLIDATSIIPLEEEWLYSYPHFLSPVGVNVVEQINRRLAPPEADSGGEGSDLGSDTGGSSDYAVGGVVARALGEHRSHGRFAFPSLKSFEPKVFVVDTPKQKRLGKREKKTLGRRRPVRLLDNVDLTLRLSAPRTAEEAKKRFIWFPHANTETALICWTTCPEQERPAISLFFDRHSRYEKHFWDDTTMVLNTWQTELHLSFYMLVDSQPSHYVGLPPPSRDKFPGNSRKEIRRASVGFRFDGDFFDRYWTCHYIEYIPQGPPRYQWRFTFDTSGSHEDKQWWQRKVLELYLLDGALREIAKNALAILSEVRQQVGIGEGTLSILSSEAYSSSKDNWPKFEQILQAVEEDLSSTLNILQRWTSREKDRGQEKPRWTRSDERKYRGPINKYQGSTERQIRDLGIYRDNIASLKDKLATSRQKIRDDRELYRNENIRYFTYVTVIFLPLGFAASFYSMNGAPGSDLLLSLVEFAMGAFAVTVALLASARTLSRAVEPLRGIRTTAGLAIEKYSRTIMKESLIMKDRQTPQIPATDDKKPRRELAPNPDAVDSQQRIQEEVPMDLPSPFSFWLAYFLIEKPARKVERAFSDMKHGVLTPRAIVNVLLGMVFLPVFVASWLVKVMVLNFKDIIELIRAIGKLLPQRQETTKAQDQQDTGALLNHFRKMTHPPRASRPWKLLQEKLDRRPAPHTIGQRFDPKTDGKPGMTVKTSETTTQ